MQRINQLNFYFLQLKVNTLTCLWTENNLTTFFLVLYMTNEKSVYDQ